MKLQLSEAIKNRRIEMKMSQRQLATKLGYKTSQFVSNWERGQVNIPIKQLPDLCRILKLDMGAVHKMLLHDAVILMKNRIENETD